MAGYLVEDMRKVTTGRLLEMKRQGTKIAMLTSYDYGTARIVDAAGVDIILVGDRIPQNLLTEDEVLLQYYDIASSKV